MGYSGKNHFANLSYLAWLFGSDLVRISFPLIRPGLLFAGLGCFHARSASGSFVNISQEGQNQKPVKQGTDAIFQVPPYRPEGILNKNTIQLTFLKIIYAIMEDLRDYLFFANPGSTPPS
jgi:hypothetical protein